MSWNEIALGSMMKKNQINMQHLHMLLELQSFKIALILDDSSSMNKIDSADMRTSRWKELATQTRIIIEIASIFHSDGCNVHFLNSEPVRNVTNFEQLSYHFKGMAIGLTPLSSTLLNVIKDNPPEKLGLRYLLIIIVTDGEPTDQFGLVNINEFKETLRNRPSYCFTNIVACTNDMNSIGYLQGMDTEFPRLDVINCFETEKAKIKLVQGLDFQFTFGDYIVKCLLGSIVPQIDDLDEIKLDFNQDVIKLEKTDGAIVTLKNSKADIENENGTEVNFSYEGMCKDQNNCEGTAEVINGKIIKAEFKQETYKE